MEKPQKDSLQPHFTVTDDQLVHMMSVGLLTGTTAFYGDGNDIDIVVMEGQPIPFLAKEDLQAYPDAAFRVLRGMTTNKPLHVIVVNIEEYIVWTHATEAFKRLIGPLDLRQEDKERRVLVFEWLKEQVRERLKKSPAPACRR